MIEEILHTYLLDLRRCVSKLNELVQKIDGC